MHSIGVAMIGTGFMGWVHIEALRRIGVRVVGILGSSTGKSRDAAVRWRVPKSYRNLDELLDDDEVEAVHIGTPNRFHAQMAAFSLRAGKHVMCEKPLAMNSEESASLVRIAAENPNLATAVNYNMRFYPLCVEAREKIRRTEIGLVHHVTGSYVQDWLLHNTDYNWRVLDDQGGSLRAVSDIGTHWLDLVQSITGLRIVEVFADLQTIHPVRHRPASEVETFSGRSSDGACNRTGRH